MAQFEIKKMKQGMSYSCKEKTIILNVFKYFRSQFSDKCVTEIVRRTAKATGCSEKSIFQFRKEEASAEGLKVPSTTKIRKNININSRDIKYDDTVRQAIRNIIYDLKYKNVVPSLNTILKQINNDAQIPKFSLMTLRRLMCDMGFCYEKNGSKSILVEKPSIKKENLPKKNKVKKRNQTNRQQDSICSSNKNNSTVNVNTNITKPMPQTFQNNIPLKSNHLHQIDNQQQQQQQQQQQHRLIPMHMSQHENHIMPPMNVPHNVTMVLNHRIPAASHSVIHSNIDIHFKRDIPPWMQHPHHHNMMMMKQQ